MSEETDKAAVSVGTEQSHRHTFDPAVSKGTTSEDHGHTHEYNLDKGVTEFSSDTSPPHRHSIPNVLKEEFAHTIEGKVFSKEQIAEVLNSVQAIVDSSMTVQKENEKVFAKASKASKPVCKYCDSLATKSFEVGSEKVAACNGHVKKAREEMKALAKERVSKVVEIEIEIGPEEEDEEMEKAQPTIGAVHVPSSIGSKKPEDDEKNKINKVYARNAELPPAVRGALPVEAQTIFRNVFNSVDDNGGSEESAFKQAWGALKNQGWEKQENGKWVKVEKAEDGRTQITIKAGPAKTEDGKKFFASDYAYVPDTEKPSTWKLRLTDTPGGSPDTRIVGAALAALGPGGFRGQRVQIPASDLASVKAKVKAAWKKLHPDAEPDELPRVLKEDVVEKEYNVLFLKQDKEQRLITGIVMEPDTVDSQGDVVSSEEIQKAAHKFIERSRVIGLQHKKKGPINVVESFIVPEDMTMGGQEVKKGSWLMTVKVIDDKVWQNVKDGKYTGFSIGGYAAKS